jgi:hypothetical protein
MSIIRQICCWLVVALCLTSCVKSDLEINFAGINSGEVIQRIELDRQIGSFARDAVLKWVESVAERVDKIQGTVAYPSDRELEIKIPFNNAKDLEAKLNRYLGSDSGSTGIKSRVKINQNNFIFLIRNHLTSELDLTDLALKTDNPKLNIDAIAKPDLSLSIRSPWGVKSLDRAETIAGKFDPELDRTNWTLATGKVDKIDAVFWLPNPLGIGGLIIIILGTLGYFIKYRQLPGM